MQEAREEFLRSRHVEPGVRPEIAASWRRSILSGVTPAHVVPEYLGTVNLDGQLMRVAHPVLEDREGALADTACGVVLTDGDACVLSRLGGDADLERSLSRNDVLPGYCFAESVVGTNSAAMALELGRPFEVRGAEHLAERYTGFVSAGAPIVHPASRRVLGTLNVVCRVEDASPMLMPWLLEVVREIERRLRLAGCLQEQLLLESYLGSQRDRRHPIVCLNDRMILSNAAAARLLGTVDQALLWEQASRAIHERANAVSTFVLSDGQRVSARCDPIFDGSAPVGAKIELQLDEVRSPRRAASSARDHGMAALASLAGHGARWQTLCDDVAEAFTSDDRMLLVGEPGTGKLAILRALFAGETIDVFDAALHAVEGSGEWLRRLDARLHQDAGVVVLRHLDSLDVFSARTLASMLDGEGGTRPRVVGTLTRADGAAQLHDAVLECFDSIVAVPALRDRLEDLRDLLQALAERHSSGDGSWQYMPDAIQTLSRIDWPGNVRSLESVVRQVVRGRLPGYVDARSLPAPVRAAGSRRRLSRLEQLEAAAITEALQHSYGNKVEAAESLGIARSTLYRRMRSLGLDLTEANY